MDHYELSERALRKAKFDIMVKYYKTQITNGEIPEMSKYVITKDKPFLFVTVNPQPKFNFLELKKKVEKCISKKWIDRYAYTFEQRSEIPGTYSGFHSHMIIQFNDKKLSEAKREIINTFKTMVGNEKAIDIRVKKLEFLEDKERYIQGHKDDPDKLAKALNDRKFREDYDLDLVYSNYPYKIFLHKLKILSTNICHQDEEGKRNDHQCAESAHTKEVTPDH